ncbi:hypothetical protein ACA910_018799 [Epithemia clementina (nom. ined.)]
MESSPSAELLPVCHWSPPSLEGWTFAVVVHAGCCILGSLPLGLILYPLRQRHATIAATSATSGSSSKVTTRQETWIMNDQQQQQQQQRRRRQVLCVILAVGAAAVPPLLVYAVSSSSSTYSSWFGWEGNNHHNVFPAYFWMGPFLLSTFGFSTFFKTINVAFGQYPLGADSTLLSWLLWFVLLPEPRYVQGQLQGPASWMSIQNMIIVFVFKILGISLLLSLMLQSDSGDTIDLPFSLPEWFVQVHNVYLWLFPLLAGGIFLPKTLLSSIGNMMALAMMLSVLHQLLAFAYSDIPLPTWLVTIWNGYVHLWLLYLFASFCLDFSLLTNVTLTAGRIQFEAGFDNPLVASRSLREAWGLRWNKSVGTLLKRTVYIPARHHHGWNAVAATLATFLASGLLHEYNFSIHNHTVSSDYYGKVTIFFVLMGFLMMAEQVVYTKFVPPSWKSWMQQNVPTVLISLVWCLLASSPLEQFFMPSWLEAGWVKALMELFPTFQCGKML